MSATNVHADLRAAIRQALLAVQNLPVQQWEGRQFNPTVGVPYVSESFRPLASEVRALGPGGTIAHTVNASFTLHYPANTGTLDIEEMAGALLEKFRPGTSLVYGTSKGVVQLVQRGSLVQEPDWINCSVTLSAVAYTVN
jgi:hypothetical protein